VPRIASRNNREKMIKVINPYDPDKFKEEFVGTDIFKHIEQDHSILYWENYFTWPGLRVTPRELISQNTIAVMASFYFVNLIAKDNDKPIYDIGCGGNYFKKYYNNIIGIDQPGSIHADEIGKFDEDYAIENRDRFDSAFAICSLHFVPFTDINKQFRLFVDTIKKGGRGLFTINTMHPFNIAGQEAKETHNVHNVADATYYIDKTLDFSGLEILSYDVPNKEILDNGGINNEGMTGDIRIAFERKR